ncbi:WYL domain-containing protein [Roseivirga sp. BDSF3-8]|uniref:phytanoyl-CoA dioxygenase family protein n=1 Tax=Roseivirga sp. BDSF3-8 TaxID=3241598 RepID=UPI003531CE20
MPVNRNALIRYRTIDTCLRNRFRKWTLDDLIEACSDALYEYEGIDKGVSRRTVQMDIQMMRSDKLGYNAPIEVSEKKYYTYADPEYSITNNPLTDQDLDRLTEVVDILRQFKGFAHFRELTGMVQRLEDRIHTAKTSLPSVIDLEKNENLKGLEHLDTLYQAILKKQVMYLTYQSFKAREPQSFHFHPYLLKEYRNRWFVLGKRKQKSPILTLALDRIEGLEVAPDKPYLENGDTDLSHYYRNVLGVTVQEGRSPEEVLLFIDKENAPYVLTKPIHHSQELVESGPDGVIIRLLVQHNFELEREILGFGDYMKVLQPERLRRRIQQKLQDATAQYESEMSLKELGMSNKRINRLGYTVLDSVYSQKEVRRMRSMIGRAIEAMGKNLDEVHALRNLLQEIPKLKEVVFNTNLIKVLHEVMGGRCFLVKATYFNKAENNDWYVTWHQDVPIAVKEKVASDQFYGWTKKSGFHSVCPPPEVLKNMLALRIHLDDTKKANGALRVIPKSHYHVLNDDEIAQLRNLDDAIWIEVAKGGVHIMRPLVVHASKKNAEKSPRRVIHLEFATCELPDGAEWAYRHQWHMPESSR